MQNKKQGFSLAEMLMVMFVLAIIAGVSAPIITKKSRGGSGSDPWRWVPNTADIHSGTNNDNRTGIIGGKRYDPNKPDSKNPMFARIVVNMPNWTISNHSHIIFQRNNNTVGRLVFGDDNIGLGNKTLIQINPTPATDRGINNMALGTHALQLATTGEGNTALGFRALQNNDHGTSNTAVGRDALRELSGNNANVVQILTGDAGTSSGNTAVGSRALETNTTGGSNTALGSQALENNTSGSFNVAIGHNACRNGNAPAQGPSNAICIGKDANVTGDNGVAIGSGATADANQIVLGTAGQTVIIRGNLVVENGSNVANAIVATRGDISSSNNSAGAGGAISLRTHTHNTSLVSAVNDCCLPGHTCNTNNDKYGWTSSSTYCPSSAGQNECERVSRSSSTCGSSPDTYTCYYHYYKHFVDEVSTFKRPNYFPTVVRFENCEKACIDLDYPEGYDSDGKYYGPSHGHKHANGASGGVFTLSTPSDIRLKNMKGNNNDGLDKVRKLAVWNYSYKSDKKNTPHVGVVAQELIKVFPNAVTKGADGYYLIRTEDIQYAMLNAIKELDKIVQKISNELKALEDKIASVTTLQKTNGEKISALDIQDNSIDKNIKTVERDFKSIEARLKKLEAKK